MYYLARSVADEMAQGQINFIYKWSDSQRIWTTNLDLKYSKTEYSHTVTLATVNNDIIIKYQQKKQASIVQKVPLIHIMFANYFILILNVY